MAADEETCWPCRHWRTRAEQLDRIEVKVDALTLKVDKIMGTVEDGLTTVESDVTNVEASLAKLDAEETRELADLQAALNNGDVLSPENQARFDALSQRLEADQAAVDADSAAIETVDPTPTAPADGPVGTPTTDDAGVAGDASAA